MDLFGAADVGVGGGFDHRSDPEGVRRLEPGEWVALGLVGAALVADVLLIRRGYVPLDPLTMLGRWLEHRAVRVL